MNGFQNALSLNRLSLRALARLSGVSVSYLSQIASGRKSPSSSIRTRLLTHLPGVSADDLFASLPNNPAVSVLCKRCRSPHTVRAGFDKGCQRYYCHDCRCTFILNNAPFRGHLTSSGSAQLLQSFFQGESLRNICSRLELSHGFPLPLARLQTAILRQSRRAFKLLYHIVPPGLQSRWLLDVQSVSSGPGFVLLDVFDLASGFLLATDAYFEDTGSPHITAIYRAIRLAGFAPSLFIPGPGLVRDDAFTANCNDLPVVSLNAQEQCHLESYQSAALLRSQILASWPLSLTISHLQLLNQAWRLNFNFFSGSAFAGCTPYNSWQDIIGS
jgi:hypothetical protein